MKKQSFSSKQTIPFCKIILGLLLGFNGLIAQTTYTISTLAGTGTTGYSGDGGQAISCQLNQPARVCTDAAGNIYIADAGNNCIRKVATNGIITTFAGNGTSGFSGDGGNATSAQLNYPYAVCSDVSGNIYIVDGGTRIRKVNLSGIISTYAGNGTTGFSGDGGPATSAQFSGANGIAIDASNNIYVTDYGNNRIRKITPTGTISTIAGNGTSGYNGDGGLATAAQIAWVAGIAVDNNSNIYITDNSNNVVRKINTSGIISTIAGNGTMGFSGDGGPATSAQLSGPYALAIDAANNLYISDNTNNRIRVVGTNSIISTIAGNGTTSFGGDGGPALSASLNGPNGITLDNSANVYFVDYNNNRVRKLIPSSTGVNENILNNYFSIFPNPTNGSFKLQIDNEVKNVEMILVNSIGQKVYEHKIIQGINNIITFGLAPGLYNCILLHENRQINSGRLMIE